MRSPSSATYGPYYDSGSVFPVEDYTFPVWCRSVHASKVELALNNACRVFNAVPAAQNPAMSRIFAYCVT